MSAKITCRTIDGKKQEFDVDELTFRPSAYGLAIKDGKILLSPQWDGYDFPGGGVDKGERLEAAVIREVKEETGLDVTVGDLLLVADDFFVHPRSGKPLHSVLLFYRCEVIGGSLSDEGLTEFERGIAKLAEWVDIDKALGAKFYNPIDSPALIRKVLGSAA